MRFPFKMVPFLVEKLLIFSRGVYLEATRHLESLKRWQHRSSIRSIAEHESARVARESWEKNGLIFKPVEIRRTGRMMKDRA